MAVSAKLNYCHHLFSCRDQCVDWVQPFLFGLRLTWVTWMCWKGSIHDVCCMLLMWTLCGLTVCSLSFIVWQWVRWACSAYRSQSSLCCSRQTNTVAHDSDLTQYKEYNGCSELDSHDSEWSACLGNDCLLCSFLVLSHFSKDETRQGSFVCKRQMDKKKWLKETENQQMTVHISLSCISCSCGFAVYTNLHTASRTHIFCSLLCSCVDSQLSLVSVEMPLNLFACMVFVSTMCALTDDPEDLITRKTNAACSCVN